MATSSIVNTLGAGSGIDVKSLAQSLVDAEKTPKKERIDAKIAKSEARISGYSAIKFALSDLKNAFAKLNDASDFSSIKTANTQPAITVYRPTLICCLTVACGFMLFT